MPAFFLIPEILLKRSSWHHQQLLFQFFFYLLNRSKTISFHRCLRFWQEEKVSGGQVRKIRWLRHDYGFVFGQKLTHKHRCVSCCLIMEQNPWLVFPQFCAFLSNCLVQSTHNLKVLLLIDRPTLWQEFLVHHAIAIEENSKQNLPIWPNLTLCNALLDISNSFCSIFLLLNRSKTGWLGFAFNVIAMHPLFDLFEQI